MHRPLLYIGQILKWADAHRRRTGDWPRTDTGRVVDAIDEKWANIDQALRIGLRGLPGRSSLAQLLAEHRGKRNRKRLPRYTIRQILTWADADRRRTGRWPTNASGLIPDAPGETWWAVDMALRKGLRGMPGGSSLAKLLARRRSVRNRMNLPRLSVAAILRWADAHYRRTGNWPTAEAGPIAGAKRETWRAVDKALRNGSRGLRGRSSLFKLLAAKRSIGRHVRRPPLSVKQILAWADSHHRRTGRWPNVHAGPIPEAPGESWSRVQVALYQGKRGMTAGSSIAKLLAEHRGVRNIQDLPQLSERLILKWVKDYAKRHASLPTRDSGMVPGTNGQTWRGVDSALKKGMRGLRGQSSLARLLAGKRGFPPSSEAAVRR